MVKWRAADWSSFTLLCSCVRGSARAHEVKLPWNNSCRLCEVKEDKTRVKRLVKVRTNLTCKLLLAFTTLILIANEIESIFLLHFFFSFSFFQSFLKFFESIRISSVWKNNRHVLRESNLWETSGRKFVLRNPLLRNFIQSSNRIVRSIVATKPSFRSVDRWKWTKHSKGSTNVDQLWSINLIGTDRYKE